MKGFLKQRKGFSLVELLIALLIMAIIAGTAITLFGGVLETSRGGADRETAESIKRAILTYMNASNDTNLSALGSETDGYDADQLVQQLAAKTIISASGVTSDPADTALTLTKDDKDIVGSFGPFLESAPTPDQSGMDGWAITIQTVDQIITVEAATDYSLTISD